MSFNKALNDDEVVSEMRKMVRMQPLPPLYEVHADLATLARSRRTRHADPPSLGLFLFYL